jgi:hypothetical protein
MDARGTPPIADWHRRFFDSQNGDESSMKKRPPNARAKHTLPPEPVRLPGAGETEPAPLALTGDRLRIWNDIRSRWSLDTASEALLRNGCESLERAAQLAEQVSRDGATFKDRFGAVRVNPAAQLERDFRGLAARTLQQLAARLEG